MKVINPPLYLPGGDFLDNDGGCRSLSAINLGKGSRQRSF